MKRAGQVIAVRANALASRTSCCADERDERADSTAHGRLDAGVGDDCLFDIMSAISDKLIQATRTLPNAT